MRVPVQNELSGTCVRVHRMVMIVVEDVDERAKGECPREQKRRHGERSPLLSRLESHRPV